MKSKKMITGLEPLEGRRVLAASLVLSGPPTSVFEGESAAFTLRLSEPLKTAERVVITTVAGTATYGSDYFAPLTQQIVFAPGQTAQTFSISTLRDAGTPLAEGREQFRVIAKPLNAALGRRAATVTIDDFAPQPVIAVTGGSVVEGQIGTSTVSFILSLSSPYTKPVSVSYATRDASATSRDLDYVATTGRVTFAPGETQSVVSIVVNGDRKLERDETFSLVLGTPSNASIGRGTALATIVNDEIDQMGFQVTLKFVDGPGGVVPQEVRTVAQQAVSRWARVITGDVEGVTVAGGFIDDFEMTVQMGLLGTEPTDGASGVLANARPTGYRAGTAGLPYAGITGLDPSDTLGNPALLLDTITHEMGHAFGFAPFADAFGRWIAGETFVGPNALREYRSIFNASASGVPLESGDLGHWDEAVFGNELMSPFTTGSSEYISRVTIGALQDMGYTVSYAAAEPYVRPNTFGFQVAAATGMIAKGTPPSPRRVVTPHPVAQVAPGIGMQRKLAPVEVLARNWPVARTSTATVAAQTALEHSAQSKANPMVGSSATKA